MDYPLISVIIPAYNAGRYLDEALISVFEQDYKPMEVIVVDDGSTDNTSEVARSFKNVIYTYQSNRGPAAARNSGLAMAHGDIIAFLDDLEIAKNDVQTSMMQFGEKWAYKDGQRFKTDTMHLSKSPLN